MQVWPHFDDGSCPGQGIGVRTRLENGLSGFILTRNLSDRQVNSPEERVKVREMVALTANSPSILPCILASILLCTFSSILLCILSVYYVAGWSDHLWTSKKFEHGEVLGGHDLQVIRPGRQGGEIHVSNLR